MKQTCTKRALLLGSGATLPKKNPLMLVRDDLVVCADGGAALARAWGLKPTVILGDWDSLTEEDQNYWQEQNVFMQKFSEHKDQTDLDLAVEFALKAGAEELHLVGGWGDRVDHSLGNLELLYRLAKQGIPNFLYAGEQKLSACQKSLSLKVKVGSIISLIPLTPEVGEVSTEGLEYPLAKADLTKGSTWTISNRAIQENVLLTLTTGVLLVIFE